MESALSLGVCMVLIGATVVDFLDESLFNLFDGSKTISCNIVEVSRLSQQCGGSRTVKMKICLQWLYL